MKTKIYGILIISVLFVALIYSGKQIIKLKQQVNKHLTNEKVMNSKVEYYRGSDSLLIAKIGVIELNVKESKKIYSNLKDELRSIKVKLRNVSSITRSEIETINNFRTYVSDTLVYDTMMAQKVSYHDQFYDFEAFIIDGEFDVKQNVSRDSLIQVIYKERQNGFLWGLFKRKAFKQVVKSYNPNSTITYVETLKISKK